MPPSRVTGPLKLLIQRTPKSPLQYRILSYVLYSFISFSIYIYFPFKIDYVFDYF